MGRIAILFSVFLASCGLGPARDDVRPESRPQLRNWDSTGPTRNEYDAWYEKKTGTGLMAPNRWREQDGLSNRSRESYIIGRPRSGDPDRVDVMSEIIFPEGIFPSVDSVRYRFSRRFSFFCRSESGEQIPFVGWGISWRFELHTSGVERTDGRGMIKVTFETNFDPSGKALSFRVGEHVFAADLLQGPFEFELPYGACR